MPFHVGIASETEVTNSTQILDVTGHDLQATTPSSYFASFGRTPIIQVRNITDSDHLGGGGVYVLDLSQPSAPVPVALKTTAGTPFNLPTGTQNLYFRPVTSTIGVADNIGVTGGVGSSALIFDRAKSVVVPISMPNSNLSILTGY